jgi:hypothetical protein
MNITSIDNLKKANDFYDLTSLSFIYKNNIDLFGYHVQYGEEMRIDLVMQSIDINLSDLDIILYINNIDNPLNIKEGMLIMYPDASNIEEFRLSMDSASANSNEIKEQLIPRPNKTTRKDPKRQKYVEERYSLPPVVMDTPKSSVRIEDGNIIIGGL